MLLRVKRPFIFQSTERIRNEIGFVREKNLKGNEKEDLKELQRRNKRKGFWGIRRGGEERRKLDELVDEIEERR